MRLTILNIIFAVLFTLTFNLGFSQKVTKQSIDSAFRKLSNSFKRDRGVMYVINGVLFDSLQLETALSKYDLKSLVELRFVTCENTGLFHCYNDAAVILFAYKQKTKVRRKYWKTAKQLLADKDYLPTLSINNSVVSKNLTHQTFDQIRLKDIMYIDTTQIDNSCQIRIWTVNPN
jgi:hypothetical protein